MDIKEAIDKLQSIDVNDLKNIDWDQVKSTLLSKPDLIVVLILVALTVGGSVYLFFNHQKAVSQAKQTISTLEEQLEASKTHKQTKNELDKFLEKFPQAATVDQVINVLSSYASEQQLKILSFTPAQKEEGEHIIVSQFSLSVAGNTFPKILSFLKLVEESPYAVRVQNWETEYYSETQGSQRRRRNQQRNAQNNETQEGIKLDLKLALVELKI